MKYSAFELARAAGLFVVVDDKADGLVIADGVAFVGPKVPPDELATGAARVAMPRASTEEVSAVLAALGYRYVGG